MPFDVLAFLALLFAALAMIPAGAHLLEMHRKLTLGRDDYLIVQTLYRGWSRLGVILVGALVTSIALVIAARHQRDAFAFAIVAAACLITMLAIFFVVTFPVNRKTRNWTMAPEDWAILRKRWEYSHAASALLSLAAFAAIALAVIRLARG